MLLSGSRDKDSVKPRRTSMSYLLLFLIPFVLFGQDTSKSEKGREPLEEIEKLDQGTNLERKHLKNASENLKDRIYTNLRLLSIVSVNFGEEVPESKTAVEKIRKDYQIALRYYYRRAYIVSGRALIQIDKEVSDLLSKYAKVFDSKAQGILTDCADAITDQEQKNLLDSTSESGRPGANYKNLTEFQQKLKLGYQQLGLAEQMKDDERFFESIVHFRIAKDYGIRILADLKDTDADKKLVLDKFVKDISDNKNLIYGGEGASNTPPAAN